MSSLSELRAVWADAKPVFDSAMMDSERLEWMEQNKVGVISGMVDDPNGEPTIFRWQCEGAGLETARPTLREAIDAARNAPKVL